MTSPPSAPSPNATGSASRTHRSRTSARLPPRPLAAALATFDQQVADGDDGVRPLSSGAGRAGLVSGAWLIASGGSGDQAAALYQGFLTTSA